MSVVLDGQKFSTSKSTPVLAGLNLGPTLFLIYRGTSNLSGSILSKLVMHADDTTIFHSTNQPKPNSQQRQHMCEVLNKDPEVI